MTLSSRLTLLTLAGVVAVGSLSYCAGRSEGAKSVTLRANGARTHTAVHATRAREIQTAKAQLAAARVDTVWREARAHVVITSDTTVSVDSLPDIPVAPLVISVLRADDRKASSDSLLIVSLEAENVALREERDAWKERVELLKPPRCGMKCGIAIGASIVLTVAWTVAHVVR
jgi:hypothetical protein